MDAIPTLTGGPLGWACAALLALLMPLTAFSFVCFRRGQKEAEYKRITRALGYRIEEHDEEEPAGENGCPPAYVPSISKEYRAWDYVAPVAFATILTFIGAAVLIQGPSFVGREEFHLLLDAPHLLHSDLDTEPNGKLVGLLVIGLAFIGAYIWSAQALYRRVTTLDLPPNAYYGIGIRILFSVFVALMVYYLFPEEGGKLTDPALMAVTVFLAGMFPERALRYLQERVQIVPRKRSERAHPLPLAMIQGVQLFERVRLAEIGIDNAQNLAKSNFVEVLLRTPFNPREIIDWIGQARLYLFFTEEIRELRKAGVRTIFDFRKIATDDALLQNLADITQISTAKLCLVRAVILDDPDVKRLEEALEILLGHACHPADRPAAGKGGKTEKPKGPPAPYAPPASTPVATA